MTVRRLDFGGRFEGDFSYDPETQELTWSRDGIRTVFAPHEDWRARCETCGRSLPLLVEEDGQSYEGFWACECGTTGFDRVFRCRSCGSRWGESATGDADSTLCSYCDGTYLWEPCPACGNPDGREVKAHPGREFEAYACESCGAELGYDAETDCPVLP